MSLNIELAERILTQITEHPETHNQAHWHCGSTMCIAGFACHFAGDTFVLGDPDRGDDEVIVDDGRRMAVWQRAEELLGLVNDHIFYMGRDTALAELERLIVDAKRENEIGAAEAVLA